MPHDHSYKAKVTGNVIRWPNGLPSELRDSEEHDVRIVISESEDEVHMRSRKAAAILAELSQLNPFAEIEDPSEWQREIRKDRPLPGRE